MERSSNTPRLIGGFNKEVVDIVLHTEEAVDILFRLFLSTVVKYIIIAYFCLFCSLHQMVYT